MGGVPHIAEAMAPKEVIIDSILENVNWQMGLDKKNRALKQLQGHMWRAGYKSGVIKGQ